MDRERLIEFSAAYRRYTPELSALLVRIGTALGTIRGAAILPAVADELRASARAGTVHFSNLIEGNELPLIEARRAARGELAADSRARIELVNYVDALDLIERRLRDGGLTVDARLVLDVHRATTAGLGRERDSGFHTRHEGAWRDGHAVVIDHLTRRVMHEAPPPDEVPARMAGLLDWQARRLAAGEPAFVIAGVVHYAITDIHPFADGNGRTARLLQTAILMRAGVLPGRMFSFERYYAQDRSAYYDALRSVRRRTLNMEAWLEYFLRGLAEEYERVAGTVSELGTLMRGRSAPVRLSDSQQRAIATLGVEGRRELSRRDYERAAGIGRSAAGDDLRALVSHGILIQIGAGPATRYRFPGAASTTGPGAGGRAGRPRRWTDEAIEAGLREFLQGRLRWPTPDEFRAAGRGPLYAAASRAGGVGRWRRRVGL